MYAARVSRGRVADRKPIVVTSAPGDQHEPQVASDGAGFLVAWNDLRSGDGDLYGARIDGHGRVLDRSGLLVFGAPGSDSLKRVEWTGLHYLVGWTRYASAHVGRISGRGWRSIPPATRRAPVT